MTSTTERYRAAASQSASAVEKIADFWTQGSQRLTDRMLPGLPQVDLVPMVERYFEFVQRTVDISRDLTLKWAEAAGTLSGAAREQAESIGGLVRAYVHCQKSGRRLAFVGVTPRVSNVLRLTGVEPLFDSYATLGEAESAVA